MKIAADYSKCVGIGICESVDPDRFEITDSGEMVLHNDGVATSEVANAETAVANCPSAALRLAP